MMDDNFFVGAEQEVDLESENQEFLQMKAKIGVIGIGGAGNNAVNRMIEIGLSGVKFIAANTDAQDLIANRAKIRIQLGRKCTKGLGAGSDPVLGRKAAEEAREEIKNAIKDVDMLFITAGMGGGTGTGAAPVVAAVAKELGIVTVAVVTKPFAYEGIQRMRKAEGGIEELKKAVDTIIVILNENLNKVSIVPNQELSFKESLHYADEVLNHCIGSIVEIIDKSGDINLDFADVRTTLKGTGHAYMGVGAARGQRAVHDALCYALNSPLLETTLVGASHVILYVVSGSGLPMSAMSEMANSLSGMVRPNANIITGNRIDEELGDGVKVIVIGKGVMLDSELASAGDVNTAAANAPTAEASYVAPAAEPVRQAEPEPAPQPEPVQPIYTSEPYYAPAPEAQEEKKDVPKGAFGKFLSALRGGKKD